jgi:hypothetical protein
MLLGGVAPRLVDLAEHGRGVSSRGTDMARRWRYVSPLEFVTVWTFADTAQEAAITLNLPMSLTLLRADRYRRLDVELQVKPDEPPDTYKFS